MGGEHSFRDADEYVSVILPGPQIKDPLLPCSVTVVTHPKIAPPSHFHHSVLPVPLSYLMYPFRELCPLPEALHTQKCNLSPGIIFFPRRGHLDRKESKSLLIRKKIVIMVANYFHSRDL